MAVGVGMGVLSGVGEGKGWTDALGEGIGVGVGVETGLSPVGEGEVLNTEGVAVACGVAEAEGEGDGTGTTALLSDTASSEWRRVTPLRREMDTISSAALRMNVGRNTMGKRPCKLTLIPSFNKPAFRGKNDESRSCTGSGVHVHSGNFEIRFKVSKPAMETKVVTNNRKLIDVPFQRELLRKSERGKSHSLILQLATEMDRNHAILGKSICVRFQRGYLLE